MPRLLHTESIKVLKIKDFRLFVLGRFFLTLAIQMQMSTISLQVYYEHTKEEFVLGLIGLSEAIPFIATSFFSGHVADIVNRRKIVLYGCTALLIGSLFLLIYSSNILTLLTSFGMIPLFVIVILFGVIRSFLGASMQPFMSQLTSRQQYTHAATWNTSAWHTGAILGPVVAGLIYGFHNGHHSTLCYSITTVLFALGIFFFIRIEPKPMPEREKKEGLLESMKVGLRFVFRNKMVLSALSLDLFAVLFGGAVALIPAFTDKVLHMGAEAYGLLRTAPAIGAVITAYIMAFIPPGRKAGMAMLWSVAGFGLFTIIFALTTNYWLAFLMLFITGAFDNISVVVRHSILQLMTPDNMRGRVSAVNGIFVGSSNEIGAFESGLAARLIGLVPSIAFGGVMTILTVFGIHKLNPKLKELDITKYH